MKSYDVIVIGVGGMGAATVYQCAKRGMRVLGIERFGVGHAMGSSHGASRMIRMAYYEHPDYVPLLRRAYELWEEIERESGARLLYTTGGVYMGPEGGEVVAGAVRAAREHGLAHEELSRGEIRKRYPVFELPEGFAGVWEPAAGFLIPERCVAVQAELGLRAGAEVQGHERVIAWDERGGRVTVRTDRAEYESGAVVFTAGAWTGELLRELGVPLVVTRQVMGWVWPGNAGRFELGKFPVWGVEQSDGSLAYGFPIHREALGMKVARHGRGGVTTGDSVAREITAADMEEVRGVVGRWMPSASGEVVGVRTCLYTNSPDGHFVVDRVPGKERVFVAGGFSGHGFKFASVMGEVMAQYVAGEVRLPARFLRISRDNVR